MDLENERGIFIVTVFRSILMKLIYNDKYSIIESNMYDSNVGARRKKNIRNPIFVINGIIFDVLSSKKKKAIDIQIMDYKQCFDSMWLEETMNDMFEAGVVDDQLALIYEANRKVKVAVKTPNGLSDRKTLNEIILQGDVFGPIECSVSVDTFGKECLEEGKHLYLYKGEVEIPILTMVDDALSISECGYKTNMMNAFINAKTNMKKLQYGVKKCFKMHVGKTCVKEICPDLYVDGWKLKEVSEVEAGQGKIEDDYDGQYEMKEVNHEKYLGDILSNDGKNVKNIAARKNRGHGTISQIMSMLDDICFGKFYFEVAIILRDTLLISSLLTNAEAWYNLTLSDIRELESIDETLLRRILECPVSTPREMLYLDLGVIPIRYIIMMRRLNFLKYILLEDKNSLIHKFLKSQLSQPTFNDWGQTVVNDVQKLERKLDVSDVENLPVATYQRLVKESVVKLALNYLNGLKLKENQQTSKTSHIQHKKIEMARYLTPNHISIKEAKFLFTLRSRLLDVTITGVNIVMSCAHVVNRRMTLSSIYWCAVV